MQAWQWATIAAIAIGVFWMVGAYNRLVALRTTIGAAFVQVEAALARRAALAASLVAALREPFAAEAGALDALVAALREVASAAEALKARPVAPAAAAALVAAEAGFAASFARVQSLAETAPAGAVPEAAVPLASLAQLRPALAFARGLYNQAAEAYDDAIDLFPMRMLARLYGFGPAGRL
jgi:LemA protein